MLTACPTPNSLLRIILTVLAVLMITGCVSEDGNVQAGVGNATISGGSISNVGGAVLKGSFSLSWTAPVSRQDGSPMSLAEIEGYRVYYGSIPGKYPGILDVTDGAANSITVSNIPVGDYYIVMTTYDSVGNESIQSGVVAKQAL